MNDLQNRLSKLPPEQQAIRNKCFHPSGTFVEFPIEDVETSIPTRFEKIVRMYPDRLAVKDKDRSLTYDQLNKAANRIAHAILGKRGTGSEPIALLFEHGTDAIAGILGVLKAGKFYVALNPSFPENRCAIILNDSQASLIVTNDLNVDLASRQMKEGHELLNIDQIDCSVACGNLKLRISPTDLRTLRYTSGSTGEPKGVVYRHASLLRDIALDNQVDIDDRLSLIHSVNFGSSTTHLFHSLLTGASLHAFNIKSDGIEKLARWLADDEITMLHLPPAVFRQLGNLPLAQFDLPKLRLLRLSGEAINREDFNLYKTKFGRHTLLELRMGSTEARGIACAVVDHAFSFPEKGSPAGYSCPGTTVVILDENGRNAPLGTVGEIAAKGRDLSDGYWRRSELDDLKFLKEPNGNEEQTYLTGDLGLILPDGFLIHLGRKDIMVKIRGYRVELAEIERALLEHPQIREAGVAAWERDSGEKYLAGYVVTRQELSLNVSDLNEFLRTKLPDYMIPSTFMFLESLPLTNGKLHRNGLPKPEYCRPELKAPYVSPGTDVEKRLSRIWSEILSLDQVGIHDNFFDLGGHSLAASQLISQVIQEFQVGIPIRALFDAPTVAELALIIVRNQVKPASDVALAKMLCELETMTDEEAEAAVKQLDREGKS